MQQEEDYESYMYLARMLSTVPYKQTSFWSNKRDFIPDPIVTEKEFAEDTVFVVQPVGIEPTSTALQTAAMTTSAKVA